MGMESRYFIACFSAVNLLLGNLVCSQVSSGKHRMDFPEEQEPGTVVATLSKIFNVRSNDLPGRTFQILGQIMMAGNKVISSNGEWLDIDSSTGVITVKDPVDREADCGDDSDLECMILLHTAMLPQPHFRLQDFELVITDTNDHAPKFPSTGMDRIFSINISENIRESTKISLDQFLATDEDTNENAKIHYSLSRNQHFGLHQFYDDTGASHLELVALSKLDYEKTNTVDLTLTAKDRGSPSPRSSQVFLRINVLDANDNAPKFDESVYNLELRENLPAGHIIATVVARDKDAGRFGKIRYFVPRSGNSVTARSLVTVDPASGTVRLLKPLDRERKKVLRVVIAAEDLASVAEGGKKVGKTVLLIQIMDVNDNAPRIQVNVILKGPGKAAYVPENAELGMYIAHISASDADNGESGKVALQVTTIAAASESVDDYFRLKSDYLIATNAVLDREKHDRFIIRIMACDFGNPKRCSHKNLSVVVLDSNDHKPEFKTKQHFLTLPENSKVGNFIASIEAYDEDARCTPALMKTKDGRFVESQNGDVRYSLVGGEAVFSIESKTGKMILVGKLDYEKKKTWKLIIIARDLGEYPRKSNFSLNVHVTDVNDHKPEFTYPGVTNLTVYATILEDRTITRIKTIDRDAGENGEVWYSISLEDGFKTSQKFLIDPVTGNLRFNASNKLTALLGVHTITIKARDKGKPPMESERSLVVKVTDLPLASIIPNYGEPGTSQSSRITVIVLGSLASATVILLLVLACIVIRCRKENKEIQTYNCRAAELRSGRNQIFTSKSNISNISSADEILVIGTSSRTTVKDNNFNGALANNRTRSLTSRTSKINSSHPPKYATIDNGPLLTTFALSKNVSDSTSGNRVIYTHTDGDSGKGESDKDNDNDSIGGERGQPLSQTSSEANLQYYAGYLNELVPRCTTSCRKFGHSDECWMPIVAHRGIQGKHASFACSDAETEKDEFLRSTHYGAEHLLKPENASFQATCGNFDNRGLETISETQPLRTVLDTAEQSSTNSYELYSLQEYPSFTSNHMQSVMPCNRSCHQESANWMDAYHAEQTRESYIQTKPRGERRSCKSSTPTKSNIKAAQCHSEEMVDQFDKVYKRLQSVCEGNTYTADAFDSDSELVKSHSTKKPTERTLPRNHANQKSVFNRSLPEYSFGFSTAKNNDHDTNECVEETRKILSDIDSSISYI